MTRRPISHLLRPVALAVAVATAATACSTTAASDGTVPVGGAPGDGTPDDPAAPPAEPGADPGDDAGSDRGGDLDPPAASGPVPAGIVAGAGTSVSTLDDGRTVLRGEATVPTAGGELTLADADLAIGVDADGEPTIAGTARVPFPTEGAFADAEITKMPIGEVGSAYGRDLAHIGAHLQDDRRYLFFAFDGGLEVRLPFAGREGFEAVPPEIAVPTGVAATLVLDPSDPYIYVGSNCPDLSDDDEQDRDEEQDRDRDDDRDDAERDDDDDDDRDDDADGAYYTLEPSDLPPGPDCGVGISINGNIPAPAIAGRDAFTGHVVVDGVVPLYAGVELDGSAVVALRDPGVRTVGWGTVLATVPLIDEFVDVQIPLADAAVEVQADSTRIGLSYEGSIAGGGATYELPLVGIPITIPASGNVEWRADLGFVKESGGPWRIDAGSFAEVSGEFGFGLGSFGELIGLELSDMAGAAASLRIDSTGVTATGTSRVSLHPALTSSAQTEFGLRIDARDWTQSHLSFAADVQLGGYTLAAADVAVGGDGIAVAGEIDLGFARASVSGAIDAGGFELTGEVGVNLSLDGLAEASRTVSAGLQELIDEVEQLDDDIERAREEAREHRRNRDEGFLVAKRALQAAIDALENLDDERDEKTDRIAELRRKIADEQQWYDGLSAGEKALRWTGYTARLSAWRFDITQLNARILLLHDTLRPAAVKTLELAQDGLDLVQSGLDALPVDTNPKVAGLLALRFSAVEALELAQGTVELFEIEGSIEGEVAVRIASDGVGGAFSGRLCGSNGCVALPGGSVQLGAETELCVELPGLGERCLAI